MSTFKFFLFIAKRTICHTMECIGYILTLFYQPKRSLLPPIDDHNLVTSALKLSAEIKHGHISCEEVIESFIARIKQVNPIINAVVDRRFELARKEAREIDSKIAAALNKTGDQSILELPLLGVPLSVKETIAVDGHSYTGGLKGRRFIKAAENAKVVDLLINAGMIPIALTNIPEMAMWWDASNPVYGRSSNPYDLSRITGGSSGGEAALLAAAGSIVGIGSDIGGSIRIPANFCGVFGHKPTPFVVPNIGMYPTVKGEREKCLGVGPMTRYACDLKPMLKIMAGSKANKLSLDEKVDLKQTKIFYLEDIEEPLASKCNQDILDGMGKVVQHFVSKYNTKVEKVTFDEFKHGMFLWYAEMNVKDASSMVIMITDGKGRVNPYVELGKKLLNMSEHTFHSIFSMLFEKFSPVYGSKMHSILTKKAENLRERLFNMLGDDGVLILPTHPEAAPTHNATLVKIFNVAYTGLTTCLQTPITQCPVGMTKEGLPFGLQIIAKPYNDRLSISVAEEIERAFGGWQSPSRVTVNG